MKDWFDKFLGEKFRESLLRKEGVVAPADRRYDTKTKEFTVEQRNTNYCVYFVLPFDNDLVKALEVCGRSIPYDGIYWTSQKLKCYDIVEVTYKDIENLISQLPSEEIAQFSRWASEETRLKFQREREEKIANVKANLPNLKINTLTKEATKAEYLHLLYCMNYTADDNKFCWDKYNHEYVARDFPGIPDYVANNRAFYCMEDGNYFVISKNNYDTFWASQGNGFESCFSLTSPHRYIRGVPFWIAHDGFYMCYITDGDITKWSAFPGHKCKLPKMMCRAWGYLRPNGTLAVGKTYGKKDGNAMSKEWMWNSPEVSSLFGNVCPNGFYVDTDYKMGDYSVFYDNLSSDNRVSTSGECGCGTHGGDTPFSEMYKKITFDDGIDFYDRAILSNGKFIKLVLLPKTSLPDNPLNRHIEACFAGEVHVTVYPKIEINGRRGSMSSYQSESDADVEYDVCVTFTEEGIKIQVGDQDERLIAAL